MKIHRFIGNFDFSKPQLKISDKELVNQISNVLKLKKGEQVFLCDGKLNEALSAITDVKNDFIEVKIGKASKNENESKVHSILYCAILKKENFEFVAQKATEAGIEEIVPIIAKRTVKLNLNHERLKKIIKEAAEQSGRGIVPVLHNSKIFEEALGGAKQSQVNIFLDKSGKELKDVSYKLKAIGIWVGPEGGWDESEKIKAKSAKFEIASLGKLTLRAETAAVIASYIININGQDIK